MPLAYHVSFCLCLGLLGPLLPFLAGRPVPGEIALVVAPPWRALPPLIESAGGRTVGPDEAPLARLALSADPAFFARLRAEGAWLVLDGRTAARLCGVPT